MPLRHTKLRILTAAAGGLLLALPVVTHAQFSLLAEGIPGCDFQTGLLEAKCIPNFIAYLIKTIFGLTGLICLVTVMYAGYEIAIGGATGDSSGGKQRLLYALVGLVVCVCAFLIVDFIVSALLNG